MKKTIRVLCVFSTLDRGGAESMCMNLYRQIDRTKVQFDFVKHTHSKGAFEDEIISFGGRIYEAPRYKMWNYLSYRKWWMDHLKNHPEHKIIHGHFFTISAVYFKFAKKMHRITVGHCHSAKPDCKSLKSILKYRSMQNIERLSSYCLACSEEAGNWLYPHRKFKVLNNAIDIQMFMYSESKEREIRRSFGLTDELIIGHVGNFAPVKNHGFLVDVFNEIHDRDPHSKLIMVGGNDHSNIEQKVNSLGLNDAVIFTGARSDIADILQAFDVFVFPSISEGLPVTVIEAQAAGLKCFLSNVITKEVDLTGRCVYLPIENSEIWADRIMNADLTKANTLQSIEKAGYDIHSTAKWLEKFYLRIVQKG